MSPSRWNISRLVVDPHNNRDENIQPVAGSSHGVTLIPLNTLTFDLDVIQRLQHGTTVIHYDPESGRSILCRLSLDASCNTVSWHRVHYGGNGRDARDRGEATPMMHRANTSVQLQYLEMPKYSQGSTCLSPRPPGSSLISLEEGYIRIPFIKAVEGIDSYDLDIEVGRTN